MDTESKAGQIDPKTGVLRLGQWMAFSSQLSYISTLTPLEKARCFGMSANTYATLAKNVKSTAADVNHRVKAVDYAGFFQLITISVMATFNTILSN